MQKICLLVQDIITYGSLLRIYSVHAADYTLAFCSLAILTLRIYALFNRKRVILWLLSLAGLGSLAVGVVGALMVHFGLYLIACAVARKRS